TYFVGLAAQAGTVRVTAANQLSPAAQLVVTGGATVQFNGFSQAIAGLGGSGDTSTLDLGTTAGTVLTPGRQGVFGFHATYAGRIIGTGDLVKTGLFTQQLGSVSQISTFTGTTTVRQGVLELTSFVPATGNGPLGSSTSAVKLGDAAFGDLNAALLNRDT